MRTKKVIHLFIATILVISSIGVVINKHYSGGELFSTAIYVDAESCCNTSCCCEKPVNNCTEERDYYRLVTDYVIPQNPELNHDDFPECLNESFFDTKISLFYDSEAINMALRIVKPPPKPTDIPVLFRSLLI